MWIQKKVVQTAQPFDFVDIVTIPINVLRIGIKFLYYKMKGVFYVRLQG